MAQPTLRSERLLLVPLAERHVDLLIALDADPEVLRYLFASPRTAEQVREGLRGRLELGQRVEGLGYWAAFGTDRDGRLGPEPPATEQDGVFVGLMMMPPAHGPDQPNDEADEGRVADLGYRIVRRWWRQGIASEASRRLLAHGFGTVGLSRVLAQTMAVNAGSRAVMTAVGLRYVRTFHGDWDEPLPGAELGEVEYAITRDAWDALTAPSVSSGTPADPVAGR